MCVLRHYSRLACLLAVVIKIPHPPTVWVSKESNELPSPALISTWSNSLDSCTPRQLGQLLMTGRSCDLPFQYSLTGTVAVILGQHWDDRSTFPKLRDDSQLGSVAVAAASWERRRGASRRISDRGGCQVSARRASRIPTPSTNTRTPARTTGLSARHTPTSRPISPPPPHPRPATAATRRETPTCTALPQCHADRKTGSTR